MSSVNSPLVRISLPSKGRLAEDASEFLSACGLKIYKPNPRQYEALIPALPELTVLFQRPATSSSACVTAALSLASPALM
jgi:ATP phosphoribosyltransferase